MAQVVCLLGCFIAIAQNNAVNLKEVTITDSRFERPASKKSRSVTMLTTKDIEPYVGSTLAALLNDQVGIHIISNLGVWLLYYPKTIEGLIACFTLAIPFFATSLLGDVIYSIVLVYGFSVASKRLQLS